MKKNRRRKSSFVELSAAFCSGAVIVGVLWLWYGQKANTSPPSTPPSSLAENNSSETSGSTSQLTEQTQLQTQTTMDSHMSMVSEEASAVPANGRVKFKIDHFKKLALQPLEFEVFDENNKALTPDDLQIVHEQRLHFIVVSSDLKEFQHLHPDFDQGKWKVLAYLPTPGTYYAYVDIAPVNGKAVVLRSDLIVRDPTQGTISYPALTSADSSGKLTVNSGPYKAQLTLSRPTLLQQTVFSFELSTAAGTPMPLQSYLGALGHAVVVKEGDPDSFLHLHPLDSSDGQNGKAQFMTTFSKAGKYVVFAEFQINGKVYTFPITFEIS